MSNIKKIYFFYIVFCFLPINITASYNNIKPIIFLEHIKSNGALKPDFLQKLSHLFNAHIFIETGTYMGDTTYNAQPHFKKIHTIELSENHHQQAALRFKNNANITCHFGDSSTVIPYLLTQIQQPSLFWLDGHYSAGGTAKGQENTPIAKEINAIKTIAHTDPILLIDDIRCFESWQQLPTDHPLEGYPSVFALQQYIHAFNQPYTFKIIGDIAIAYPSKYTNITSPIVDACTISRLFDDSEHSDSNTILKAEHIIAQATGAEKEVILTLADHHIYTENLYQTGKHYRLWRGLVLAQDNQHAAALKEFKAALNLGLTHWRIHWYIAQSAYKCSEINLCSQSLNEVMKKVPQFNGLQQLLRKIQSLKK